MQCTSQEVIRVIVHIDILIHLNRFLHPFPLIWLYNDGSQCHVWPTSALDKPPYTTNHLSIQRNFQWHTKHLNMWLWHAKVKYWFDGVVRYAKCEILAGKEANKAVVECVVMCGGCTSEA